MNEPDESLPDNSKEWLQQQYTVLKKKRDAESNSNEARSLTVQLSKLMDKMRKLGIPVDEQAVGETRRVGPSRLERILEQIVRLSWGKRRR